MPSSTERILRAFFISNLRHRLFFAKILSCFQSAGDLRKDSFGEAYDLIFVSAICHMLNPSENLDLLRKCHTALRTNGRVVVQDFILEADKTAPKSAALFALNMLVGTPAGSSYSGEEYAAWFEQAGFHDTRHVRLRGPSSLIIGRK